MHRITQHADSRNADLDSVSGDERTDACGRAGGDDVAGKQGHHAGDPANQEGARINHERGVAGLAHSVVDARFDEDVGGIELGFDVRTDRAKGVEAFTARELHVSLLEVAGSDVIQAGVAENVGERVIGIG